MPEDEPEVLAQYAERVVGIAKSLVAPGGFPPFGIVFQADGTVKAVHSFMIDTGQATEMQGHSPACAATPWTASGTR